jgi:hypothetical protein
MTLDASLGVSAALADPGRHRIIEVCFDWQNLGQNLSDRRRLAEALQDEEDTFACAALLSLHVQKASPGACGRISRQTVPFQKKIWG